MKQKILRLGVILGLLLVLLSSCAVPAEPTQPPTQPPTQAPTQPPTQPPSLLDGAQSVGENLFHVAGDALQGLQAPTMIRMGESLLLYNTAYHPDGVALQIKRLSLADGSVQAQAELSFSGMISVQASDTQIGITENEAGKVHILDQNLNTAALYTLPADPSPWFLDKSLQHLYIINYPQGIECIRLEDGAALPFPIALGEAYAVADSPEQLVLRGTDLSTLRNETILLSLRTGQVQILPAGCEWGAEQDGVTVSYDPFARTGYLQTGADLQSFAWQGSLLDLQAPGIVALDASGSGLRLYDLQGNLLSQCRAELGISGFFCRGMVYSPEYNAILLTVNDGMGQDKLLLWPLNAPEEPAQLEFIQDTQDITQGQLVSPELYQEAARLGEKYGIQIRIADLCRLDYSHHTAAVAEDEEFIRQTLALMDDALSQYPPNYLSQLSYGDYRRLCFDLVGGITPKDTQQYSGSYAGFASSQDDHYLIVLNIYLISRDSIFHELSHVTDKRLELYRQLHPQSSYSEEQWLALQPEGFQYAMTYGQMPAYIYDYAYTGWFVSDYSCRYPTEDRAQLMENAMAGNRYVFEANPGLLPKLEYYSRCIRESFQTDGWPDVTVWEQMLTEFE